MEKIIVFMTVVFALAGIIAGCTCNTEQKMIGFKYTIVPVVEGSNYDYSLETVKVLEKRLEYFGSFLSSGFASKITCKDDTVYVRFPTALHINDSRINRVIMQKGHLAFRMVSSNNLLMDKFLRIKKQNDEINKWNAAHVNGPLKKQLRYPEGCELMTLYSKKEPHGSNSVSTETLLVEKKECLTNYDLKKVSLKHIPEWGSRLTFELTPAGSRKMAQLTGNNKGERVAVVMDGRILSAPRIQQKVSESAEIVGDLEEAEWQEIAAVLTGGELSVRITYDK